MKRILALAAVTILALTATAPTAVAKKGEPDKVVVQHILIGFKGSVRGKELTRSRKQARALAFSLLDRIEAGEDFDALVKEYTNDAYPGYMKLVNTDVKLDGELRGQGFRMRKDVVPRFGDVSFRLEVDEVEMANYHAAMSPFGWHIIKRIE